MASQTRRQYSDWNSFKNMSSVQVSAFAVWKSEFCNIALLFPAISVNCSQISCFISVLVRKAANGKAELVLLDHGLYEYLPPSVRQPLCRLWKAIVMNNHFDMKSHACELGVEGNMSPFDGKHISVNMALIQVPFNWWERECKYRTCHRNVVESICNAINLAALFNIISVMEFFWYNRRTVLYVIL